MIVQLSQPPLSVHGRSLTAVRARRRLDVRSAPARAYLAELARAQRAAVAQLRRAIPEATASRRFRIVFNGITVELPARRLPKLVRMPFAAKVFPTISYTLSTNESPSVIGADELARLHGVRGDGIKIGVVDDGVDASNPYFNPSGFSYPAGFPRGGTRWTTPKVIVARAFPAPNSGRRARWAFDPRASFHGTHVAGIAAGIAGVTAPRGRDHPETPGLSGVAPRAWIGNYRVFSLPSPIGNVANTPEILAAFESAVADGMDVINFSGGGPQTDPATDATDEVIRNIVNAGVVVVISAGNDRDEFGLGTAGSPGTAPDAISVAATSNAQVFAPALRVVAPATPPSLRQIPFNPGRGQPPPAWSTSDQTLVDVGSIIGVGGAPVNRQLCGPPTNPNGGPNPLPPRSLAGVIALVSRGTCTFASKAEKVRAAGGIGIVLVDNRPGEPNGIPLALRIPAGMISDLDGARLRELMATTGGRTLIRVGSEFERIETGRSGIVTSFSSGGPTAYGHDLKPDVSAPGGSILSSTMQRLANSPFAVFDGTSMAAPHVAGAAALLLQRNPAWAPRVIKSALVSTAGPAWADTARTAEAPVLLEGGGLVNLPAAADPKLLTEPVSLSFGDLDVTAGGRSDARLVRLTDLGDGAGTWSVELRPQNATRGATISLPSSVTVPPGGEAPLTAVAGASADADAGDNFGFIVLRRGEVTRRVPYYFAVHRPALASLQARPLRTLQSGSTLDGPSRATQYRFPSAPFGPPPTYVGPPVVEDGNEDLYTVLVGEPSVNIGAAVVLQSRGALIHPWFLGSPNENDVEGFAGTPVNVNSFMFDYRADVGVAGVSFPRPKRYWVSVDSGRDPFTGRSLGGRYVLQSWRNDVFPPLILPVTQRVSAGRPTIVVRVVDLFGRAGAASGIDPLSLVIGYRRALVGAAFYDPVSGLAVFPLPSQAPTLRTRDRRIAVLASDNQETKNVNTPGGEILPNTSVRQLRVRVVAGPALTWLAPEAQECVTKPRASLAVAAGSTAGVRWVRFFDGDRRIATVRRGAGGLYGTTWRTRGLRLGTHRLRAVVRDARGRTAAAARIVRVCK